MKVNLEKNTLQINFKTGRTKAQKHAIAKMIDSEDISKLTKYLSTFSGTAMGVNPCKVKCDRYAAFDLLSAKKPNSVNQLAEKFYKNTGESHRPFSKDPGHLGIEIECFIPWESVGMDEPDLSSGTTEEECCDCEGSGRIEFQHRNSGQTTEDDCQSCEGRGIIERDSESDDEIEEKFIEEAHDALSNIFKKNKIKFSTIKTDGSIKPDDSKYFPVEITVLTKMSDTKNLLAVCKLINSLGAKVNKSCGMHVHLDARHLDEKQVEIMGRRFQKTMPVLASLVPETRRDNSYCELKVSNEDRYSAINLTAYEKYKTVEIRLHSSTTDFNKIYNWCYLLNAISKTHITHECKELNELTSFVYLPENLLEYFTQRAALFSDKQEGVSEIAQDLDEAC